MLIALQGVLVDGSTPVIYTPTVQPINVYQGVDTIVQVGMVSSNGNTLNITGWTGAMVVKDKPPGMTPSYTQTYSATLSNPTGGIMQFSIPGVTLKGLSLQSYYFDVFTTNSGNRDEVVLTGTMTVNGAIGA